ncbi:putative membrane protein [Pyrobaculum oguniense TE7]|uniref:Membrane protein n=1 Tax=Pyrobaculum oguniense (strain DSM 13380 / JCM 10595 / TE7) TaxID=698757 RepID=H6Q9T9_PYROT|nr:putative membrane protein [Pyrobaculum oguniense TE7]
MDFEKALEIILRAGALASAATIGVGLVLIYAFHGSGNYTISQIASPTSPINSSQFSVWRVLRGVVAIHGLDYIYLGLIMLIATPLAAVVLNLANFVTNKNAIYTAVVAIVLLNMLFSLFVLPLLVGA